MSGYKNQNFPSFHSCMSNHGPVVKSAGHGPVRRSYVFAQVDDPTVETWKILVFVSGHMPRSGSFVQILVLYVKIINKYAQWSLKQVIWYLNILVPFINKRWRDKLVKIYEIWRCLKCIRKTLNLTKTAIDIFTNTYSESSTKIFSIANFFKMVDYGRPPTKY